MHILFRKETRTLQTERTSQPQALMQSDRTSPPSAPPSYSWGTGSISSMGKELCSKLSRIAARRGLQLRRLLYECRSFQHRIRIALNNTDVYRLPMGFEYLESPERCVYLNIRCHARIQHIQKISSIPWATPIDWKTHLESWDAGVEWAVSNLGSGSTLPDQHKALLASELSYEGQKTQTSS
jgi:hypothetical protein